MLSLQLLRYFWDYCHRHPSKIHALGADRIMICKNRNSKVMHSEEDEEKGSGSTVAGKLVIVVTDTGAGISANNQKRLFNEIVQFNPEKLQAGGGSGLGLWITSNIIDMHDGEISVASGGEGQGCSFTVKIPMLRCSSLEPPPPPQGSPTPDSLSLERSQGSKSPRLSLHSPNEEIDSPFVCSRDIFPIKEDDSHFSPSTQCHLDCELRVPIPIDVDGSSRAVTSIMTPTPSGKRIFDILVVDDSNLNRKMLIKCLGAEHHVCEHAVDGVQAIERVKKRMHWNDQLKANSEERRPYDVILMDFMVSFFSNFICMFDFDNFICIFRMPLNE